MKDYQLETFYPGKYTARERASLLPYWSQLDALNANPVTFAELKAGPTEERRGRAVPLTATPELLDYYAGKYDPENPLYTDDAYARSMGYRGRIAYPTFGACDDCFGRMAPPTCRDALLVCGVNTSMRFYSPIYPGDTVYPVTVSEYVTDVTPEEGSTFRTLTTTINGAVYNQDGVKVLDVQYRCRESNQCYAGEKPEQPG